MRWYTLDGRSTRKAFLRSPMEFSRMTSGFSLARFHPILQTWRAHRGIDYAAPDRHAGARDGRRRRHDAPAARTATATSSSSASTAALLDAVRAPVALRAAPATGARVRQGETIGYVGATGWATGPHLHYEFRIDDEARNPADDRDAQRRSDRPSESFGAFLLHIAPLAQQLALARELPAARFASHRLDRAAQHAPRACTPA